MTIDFELSPKIKGTQNMLRMFAEQAVRPQARKYDEEEHEKPWDLLNMVHGFMKGGVGGSMSGGDTKAEGGEKKRSERQLTTAVTVEEIFWGDAGIALAFPGQGLGGAAVQATGSPEQKEQFLARFSGEKPVWGAMAITEPEAGSDTANLKTTAVKVGNDYVLNGVKWWITNGSVASWYFILARTGDELTGFIVPADSPGIVRGPKEINLGQHASNTVRVTLEDVKVPEANRLGAEAGQLPADSLPKVIGMGLGYGSNRGKPRDRASRRRSSPAVVPAKAGTQ